MLIKRLRCEKSRGVLQVKKVRLQNGGVDMNARIQELQNRLSLNMNKAVLFAERNTTRNEQGYVVLKKDDEWRNEDEWEE
ncbi:UNVERIFIED_ORG: hypothetical protein B2H93_13430 [Clostridium botulinum]